VLASLRSARRRKAWLADPDLARALAAGIDKPRGRGLFLRADRSAGLRFPWAGTTVEFRITPKPRGGVTVVVTHTKLPDRTQVEERRGQWKGALGAFKTLLEG